MKSAMMLIMAMIITTAMFYGEAIGQPPPMPAEEQPQVLTRGPVNEAFAQPVNLEDQTGFFAPTEPPPNIEEAPPAERPAGEQFAWVPGYWAWDSDRNGYIWVSGCWRAVPPDMYWVPGYWARASAGWQWVAGFWAPVSNEELEYLPAPPTPTIEEPPPPQFASDKIWVPACWYWNNGQYILRSGYWIEAQQDWVWVPSHYVWTPRGYVFAPGHWDYSLDRRGVLFAPVYFPRHIYERRGYSYPLSITINIDNFQLGLFSRPQYSHYYFGDYYDSSYISIGIFPWFQYEQRHTWYDPIYAHARWRHHNAEPRWEQHQRHEYERRRSDVTLRPPRTYREMESRMSNMSEPQRKDFKIAVPITEMAYLKKSRFKFEKISPKGRARISKDSIKVQKFVKERRQWESKGPGHKSKQPAIKDGSPARTNKEMKSPEKKPEKMETRPSERIKSATPEHKGRLADPSNGRQGKKSTKSPQQQQSKKVTPHEIEQNKADRVKVRTPPVVDKQRGASGRKGLPSRPPEEMNTPVKRKGSKMESSKQIKSAPEERKESEVKPSKQMKSEPAERKGSKVKPSKQIKSAPAERKGQGAAPGKGGKDSTTSPKQPKSKNVSPQETEQDQTDREDVLTPSKDDRKDKGGGQSRGKGGGDR